MQATQRLPKFLPLLLLPMLLFGGCSSVSLQSKPVPEAVIPPLPAEARQTDSPEHSANAQSDTQRWLQLLTAPSSAAKPASAPTSR